MYILQASAWLLENVYSVIPVVVLWLSSLSRCSCIKKQNKTHTKRSRVRYGLTFFFFLAKPSSLQGLSFLTRGQIWASFNESPES